MSESPIYESRNLGCHETAIIAVSSIVMAAPGDAVSINARATAGASPITGQIMESDSVVGLGNFNCDESLDSIDAALILQLSAALIQPFSCVGAGDVNYDGFTNAIDASLILQYTAGLITEFP